MIEETIKYPLKLYKYVPFDRIDIIENKCLCFSRPTSFNDPFDSKPHVKGFASPKDFDNNIFENEDVDNILDATMNSHVAMKHLKQLIPEFSTFIEKAKKDAKAVLKQHYLNANKTISTDISYTDLSKIVGILSLTTKYDNLLMWSHYAKDHTGFVIEFDATKPFFTEKHKNELLNLKKVNYSKIRPQSYLMDQEFEARFFVKSEEWVYEDEWRLLKAVSKTFFKDDEQKHPLVSFNADIITAVILGCKMSEPNRSEIINKIQSTEHLQHIKIYQASEDEKEFKLNFKPIN